MEFYPSLLCPPFWVHVGASFFQAVGLVAGGLDAFHGDVAVGVFDDVDVDVVFEAVPVGVGAGCPAEGDVGGYTGGGIGGADEFRLAWRSVAGFDSGASHDAGLAGVVLGDDDPVVEGLAFHVVEGVAGVGGMGGGGRCGSHQVLDGSGFGSAI